jgi:N-acetylmuramoyl-L-alanine amidase
VKLICLDAGHGGQDKGASFQGLDEKEVVYDVVRRLELRLMPTVQLHCFLTRDKDVFVPLEDRVKFANDHHCDFFVSVHTNADADPDDPGMPEARGAEVWITTGSPKSRQLADAMSWGMQWQFPDEPWRGIKERGLYVLRNTRMPAALVELAFIDHSDTNRKLRDASVREEIAFALEMGVIRYLSL